MVGKIEKNIPEDDPRNPGVIADLVGDNVGDCAGMAADLFETYVVTAVAAMILGSLILTNYTLAINFPLAIGAGAIVASIIGTFFVVPGKDKRIMKALYKGLIVASLVSAAIFYYLTQTLAGGDIKVFIVTLIGILVTVGMVVITEFYTSKNSGAVKHIAEASITGHGTNIIAGLGSFHEINFCTGSFDLCSNFSLILSIRTLRSSNCSHVHAFFDRNSCCN